MPQRKNSTQLKLLLGVADNEIDRTHNPTPTQREPERPKSLSIRERRMWTAIVDELRMMQWLV